MADIIESDQWETPDDLYNELDEEFEFYFDAAASKSNAKRLEFSSDSLELDWSVLGPVWLNPPYSRGNIDNFIEKTVQEYLKGTTIVTLTRFDPTTSWFKLIDEYAQEIRMLARRIKFKGAKDSYNFPCCVSVFGELNHGPQYRMWDWDEERYYYNG